MLNRTQSPLIYNAVDFDLQLPPLQTHILDNGVPVHYLPLGEQDVMQVELVFYAGNWYEQKNMVAAATNFLLKNGTSSKTAFEINEHFDFYGAYLNRNCYSETATLTLHCLSKHLSVLLPVMAELLQDATMPADELAIYQQNQQQRLAVNLKKCDFVANRYIDAYLYGKQHPYGKYAEAADYAAITQADVKAFYEQYYQQGHCMIMVAGKLPANVLTQMNEAFGKLPLKSGKPNAEMHDIQPAMVKKYRVVNDEAGVQGAIRMARHFPPRTHPDFKGVQILNNIFGGYFGSRLMTNIREVKGYTYGIHSYLQNNLQDSAWMISTEAGRDVCEATIAEVYKEMELLRNEPVDAEELDLVRNYMMGTLLGDLDGPFQMIARWKNYILHGLDEHYFNDSIQTIRTITPEVIQALANKYLQPNDFYELIVV
ncbi:MAG: M16 family metallopeptidase [Chitinophagaceae bacterium]